MQCLPLCNSLRNFRNFINFNLERLLPTSKAKDPKPFLDNLMTLRTGHILGVILKARDVKVMVAWSDHDGSIGAADLAFDVLEVCLPPFDVVF